MMRSLDRMRQILLCIYWKLKYRKRIKIGKNFRFRKRLKIIIDKNGRLSIGDNNFFNNDCSINCMEEIVIGNDNLFGESIKIYDHNHVFNEDNEVLRNKFKTSSICIGNNNWVGSNAIILKNASMGDRNVIGAGVVINEKIDSLKLIKRKDILEIETIVLNNKKNEN